ncbi:MAG: hypothetical protein GY711_24310 [bacterium]|nr:hypothetical protein [bacterium]
MLRITALALLSALVGSAAHGQQVDWIQTCDSTTIELVDSPSCLNNPLGATENFYHRVFDRSDVDTTNHVPGACGVNPTPVTALGLLQVTEIRVGIEDSSTEAGSRILRLSVYDNSASAMVPQDPVTLPLLGSVDHVFTDASLVVEAITIDPGMIVIPDTVTHVQLTLMVESGQPNGDYFFWGMNAQGEVPAESSFLSAPECGITVPESMAALLYPGVNGILEMTTEPVPDQPIGMNYCTPNLPNSTGMPSTIIATGSDLVLDNDVTLTAVGLPLNEFGYFLASSDQGFIPMPGGSAGNFCLGGGANLGRYDGMVQNSGATGEFSILIDLTAVPIATAPGTTPILPGLTWNFQGWHRDGATSNFTDGVSILFQ